MLRENPTPTVRLDVKIISKVPEEQPFKQTIYSALYCTVSQVTKSMRPLTKLCCKNYHKFHVYLIGTRGITTYPVDTAMWGTVGLRGHKTMAPIFHWKIHRAICAQTCVVMSKLVSTTVSTSVLAGTAP